MNGFSTPSKLRNSILTIRCSLVSYRTHWRDLIFVFMLFKNRRKEIKQSASGLNKGLSSIFCLILFTNPSARAGYDTRSIFKWSLTGLHSEFPFSKTSCLTKAEEPGLFYYLPISEGRIIAFIPFPRVLVLCEMKTVSSKIWTRIAVSISYDDNHYTTGTSFFPSARAGYDARFIFKRSLTVLISEFSFS